MDPNLETARRLYNESLSAMDMELSALMAFAEDFKGVESYERLKRAQDEIRKERGQI